MVFSSLLFLFAFLPLTLAAYYLSPPRWRNTAALVASLIFYAWGAPRFVFVMLALCVVDYAAGRHLAPDAPVTPGRRRAILAVAVVLNLAGLLYFKYANFLVDQLNALAGACGAGPLPWARVALPIGISFFTFQKISYLADVYRGTARPASGFWQYVLYVALFPQLIAGPIVRYHDVATQLDRRDHTAERFLSGVWRFCLGLARKVLIANTLATVADQAFRADPTALSAGMAWLGVICYAFQIYFDFAGYSDMAIGLGRMLGIEFLENFNFPYISASFTEFWRRWHMSLSNFMREYLYIPLGGGRAGPLRSYANLWIVFLVSGFWHGAAWNFVVWGAYHGLFLSLDKLWQRTARRPPPRALAVPATFLLVLVGWVFFRADTLARALGYLGAMLGAAVPTPAAAASARAALHTLADPPVAAALLIAVAAALAPLWRAEAWFRDWPPALTPSVAWRRTTVCFLLSVILLVASAAALAAGLFNPFIYFRF
jgi:alginate O-acetyltransferase complex protein AlgI